MSIYKEILNGSGSARGLFPRGQQESEAQKRPDLSQKPVAALVLRVGSSKGGYLSQALEGCSRQVLVIERSDWDEDNYNGIYIQPGRRSALKVIDLKADMRQIARVGDDPGCTLSAATDVDLISGHLLFPKPLTVQTELEVADLLKTRLCGSERRSFKVRTSMAVFGKDNQVGTPVGGVSRIARHSFQVDSLTPEEVDFYVFGLEGGPFSRVILDRLQSAYGLDVDEVQLLARGLSLAELKCTNLGIRWPHPLIQEKIQEVDGVKRGDENFQQHLHNLFTALLGAPIELRDTIEGIARGSWSESLRNGQSLYKDLPGNWKECAPLKSGEYVFLSTAEDGDYLAISQLTQRNFRESHNYSDLTSEDREKFIDANSHLEVADLCCNPDNIVCLVAKDIEGRLVGYTVLRKNHTRRTADCRRIHVSLEMAGQGLGKILSERAEQFAKEAGFTRVTVQASGTSYSWFGSNGYQFLGKFGNHEGVFFSKPTDFVLMGKDLDLVI